MKKSEEYLIEKIEKLERELEEERKISHQTFLNSMDIPNLYFKGIKINDLYEHYQLNKRG